MPKLNHNELHLALRIISNTCKDYSNCGDCPLVRKFISHKGDTEVVTYECGILVNSSPANWELVHPDNYKAFPTTHTFTGGITDGV